MNGNQIQFSLAIEVNQGLFIPLPTQTILGCISESKAKFPTSIKALRSGLAGHHITTVHCHVIAKL